MKKLSSLVLLFAALFCISGTAFSQVAGPVGAVTGTTYSLTEYITPVNGTPVLGPSGLSDSGTILTYSGNSEVISAVTGKGTATLTAGVASGTAPGTPSCLASHICDSMSGVVDITVGTSTTTGVMLTVNTPNNRTNQANCDGSIYLLATPYTVLPFRFTETTNSFVFNVGVAPTASTAYELIYQCFGN